MALIAAALLALVTSANLAAARQTAAALAVIPAPTDEAGEESAELPIEAEQLLWRLHRQLAEWAVSRLNTRPAPDAAALERELRAAGLFRGGWFGAVSRIGLAQPGKGLTSLAITLESGLVEDTALHLLAEGPDGRAPVLEWSSEVAALSAPDEALERDVRKGLNALDWRLVEDADGFFLLAGWGQPGFPSSWGAVSWAVLRPGPRPRSPAVLARGSAGAYQCSEDCFELGLDGRRPWIAYEGAPGLAAISSGFTTRSARRRFRVSAADAEEDGPPAVGARGVVDAWIDAPWEQARAWSADPRLEARHRELARLAAGADVEFGRTWVEVCPPGAGREVVELEIGPPNRDPVPSTAGPRAESDRAAPALFLSVDLVDGASRLLAISDQLTPGLVDLATCQWPVPR
jgi:hypothetical protein